MGQNANENAARYNQQPVQTGANYNMPVPQTGYNSAPMAPGQNYNQAPVMPNPEQMAIRAEQLAAPSQLPAAAQPVSPVPQPVATQAQQATSVASGVADPDNAADQDKIEQEWVDKVKEVISKTQHDPFAQQMNISIMMRDYVKKRFGKTVGKAPEVK